MSSPAPTQQLVEDAIDVELIDRDLYRSKQLWLPSGGRGVFGGQIIAQSLWAAVLSIRRDAEAEAQPAKLLHSLHSYFLSFGNAEIPVLYAVSRLRDGRSYSTRQVIATQRGTPIFTLTCSFALPEPKQPTREFPLPTLASGKPLPQPEDCEPTETRLERVLTERTDIHAKLKQYAERLAAERRQSSIEVRNVDAADLGWMGSQSGRPSPEQHFWFRSRAPIKADSEFQKCVLAYASDMQFIGTAARAAGLGAFTKPRLGMLASLDHSMYFYDDAMDASEWLLFTMSSPALGHGKGLVSGRIYRRDGKLAVVCQQEGVVRAQL